MEFRKQGVTGLIVLVWNRCRTREPYGGSCQERFSRQDWRTRRIAALPLHLHREMNPRMARTRFSSPARILLERKFPTHTARRAGILMAVGGCASRGACGMRRSPHPRPAAPSRGTKSRTSAGGSEATFPFLWLSSSPTIPNGIVSSPKSPPAIPISRTPM